MNNYNIEIINTLQPLALHPKWLQNFWIAESRNSFLRLQLQHYYTVAKLLQ
ncbi:hypothetical protein KFK09_024549 [Dendrobium nobile]|uniref:Uncharacterized protein n=1 Tax=Dendrobium nobile TaxID=94219 RepID=A0A8T3AJL2_DENNO|nr:hypothetical protein KFK09_024549 [Dendrobium nobile]